MFHPYSSIFTMLHLSRNICPHSDIFQQIQAYSGPVQIAKTKNTCSSSQVFLLSHCSNLFGTFLFQKQTFNIFFVQDSISIITMTTKKHTTHVSTPGTLARYLRKHATHLTHASILSTPTMVACFR